MKNKPWITGIIAAASPIPAFCFTFILMWVVCIGIARGLLQCETTPIWALIISEVPLLTLSPFLGLFGIVHSLIKIKQKYAWLGLLLSIFCLIEHTLLMLAIMYFSSIT